MECFDYLMGNCCCNDESVKRDKAYNECSGNSYRGDGKALGGSGVTSDSGISARDAAAAAALGRANTSTDSKKNQQLAERRRKDELVGKIQAHYQAAGKDPPIGLSASSIDALKRHLEHVKGEAGRTKKAAKISQAIR
uniref:Uncharacterized protein n=1 Tax=Octactis speculum TaxID=3111310 RepID=A0A7S2DYM6_9STRA|mmetsp:Transcript_55958/g.76347  ORF Transcript_55958/g.76347 Transcript_55958/m.76347 type:complete len:138 (+) Transcript_55958:17-430(+)